MTEPSNEQTTTEPVKIEIPQMEKKSVGGWLALSNRPKPELGLPKD